MNTIAGEFGGSVPHSLSEYYRGGGLVPNTPTNAAIPTSGTISMGNFYGSSARAAVSLTITGNTYNYDVYANRGPAYIAGVSDVTVTVNPGVTVGSTSTGTYAMLVPSSFSPGDTVSIVNNGVIQGMGGAGGAGGPASGPQIRGNPGSAGAGGGNAIYVNRPTVITNNGTVAGGGGGGGGGGGAFVQGPFGAHAYATGGGGGGGAGFNGGAGGPAGALVGTGGGVAGQAGGSGTSPAGGGGGAGGVTGAVPLGPARGGAGGAGGGRGAAGSSGSPSPSSVPAPSGGAGAGGGATGNYIVGNPFVTWPATGTRQGGVA